MATKKKQEIEKNGLCIELPKDGITEAAQQNLHRLIAGKVILIQKSLGASSLDIEITKETIRFPWFDYLPEQDVITAATELVAAMVKMAKTQKRVTAKESCVENEKYAFRCFLLRLGFIGDEYKQLRKTLLRNLSGNTAFKSGGGKR